MKKILSQMTTCLTIIFCMAVTFTACNKDDDNNGPTFSKNGKRLVSKITMTSEEYPDEKDEVFFSYNGDGEITAIEYKSYYTSEETGKKCIDSDLYTYSVSGKTLTVVNKYEDGESDKYSGTYGGTFTLNEDGLVVSGKETDSDEDDFVYTCHYNDDRYLTTMEYTRNDRPKEYINYTWDNGDIIKGVYNYIYYEDVNKANIEFFELESFMLGYDQSFLGMAGYLGKKNKHLLKKESSESKREVTYDIDNDGYVKMFSITSWGDIYNYQVSYN